MSNPYALPLILEGDGTSAPFFVAPEHVGRTGVLLYGPDSAAVGSLRLQCTDRQWWEAAAAFAGEVAKFPVAGYYMVELPPGVLARVDLVGFAPGVFACVGLAPSDPPGPPPGEELLA